MAGIQAKVKKNDSVSRVLVVSVDSERVEAEMTTAFGNIASKAKVKGFRKGKAPREVLEQEYGGEVREDVIGRLIEDAFIEVVREHELDIVGPPHLTSREYQPAEGLKFEATVEIRPKVKLGRYKRSKADRKVARVEDDQVNEAMESLRQRMAVLEAEEDRVNVQAGDVITMDMYASLEGQPLDRYTRDGQQVEVGSGSLPDDFERGLLGVTRSIPTPIDVRFPENNGEDSEVAGRLVRFQVTVREIKNKIVPSLNDSFAAELGWDGVEDLASLREKVSGELHERASQEADRRVRGELLETLVGKSKLDLPPLLVERTALSMLGEMGMRDIPRDKFDELKGIVQPEAEKRVRAGFVLDAVAEAESLGVEPEEMEKRVGEQLAAAGERAGELRKHYSQPGAVADLKVGMLRDKAMDCLVEQATLKDVEVDPADVAAPLQTG